MADDPSARTAADEADEEAADAGGDEACWSRRVCPACGRLHDVDPPDVCEVCGADLPD